ncbi:LysR family transcriptional regulator [Brevibacterium sp. 50QC2O2]|uniref:LysR family transcriptional regulator n=1 Tax=Brevibacterium sp. 50QC2O2 TaxID=2968459 RepID=UPI00211C352F|nr:LysR family transcriptional regulator [Brevibacterium sp. 50QC2O2]MCQ9389812.1 LysR family transcriptional regulator [Brevibacterium sp. 50QC2O2]
MTLDLRDVRCFVAVAETGSFKHAAERLEMSQSALSQTLTKLETELNAALFVKGVRRSSTLTSTGYVFFEEGRKLLQHAALIETIVAERSSSAPLRVNGIPSVFAGLVPDLIRRFRIRQGTATIQLAAEPEGLVADTINSGRAEIAFTRTTRWGPEFHCTELAAERLYAALPSDHPLAEHSTIDLSSMSDEPFVLFSRGESSRHYDAIIDACEASGFTPRVGSIAHDDLSTWSTIAAGIGVTLMPYLSTRHMFEKVVYRPLTQAFTTPLCLVTHAETTHPMIPQFISATREVIAEMSNQSEGITPVE